LYEFFANKGIITDRRHPIRMAIEPIYFGLDRHALILHLNGFVKTIELLGSDAQKEKWLKRSYALDVVGCYAQTELGHGSDVRSLETTATYDQLTQEFVLDSPTISSIKFWPGGLGKTANHAVVQAQTYVDGKHIGLQTFIVPIRDENHVPLENVHIGDIGTKYSFNSTDNGFLRMSNVRVPLENMLARYTQVTSDGKVTFASEKSMKLGYGNMLFLRVFFFYFRCISLSRLATIAIRYGIVRRQFKSQETGIERQIMDYQTHQMRLFPVVGCSYAIVLTSQTLVNTYFRYEEELKDGKEPFVLLRQLHALCSTLKPIATWKVRKFGEIVKQCCGGHGFLEVSGIHRIVKEEEALITAEGANNVILQQTAKYLLEQCQKLMNGEELDEITKYFVNHFQSDTMKHLPKATDYKSLNDKLINAFERRVVVFLRTAAEKFQKLVASGLTIEQVWNEKTQQQFIKAAEYFGEAYMIREAFHNLDNSEFLNEKTRPTIEKFLQIYTIYTILDELASFLYGDFFEEHDVEEIRQSFRDLCHVVRKNAIGIVDSFGYTDDDLMSVLGSFDGDVYNKLINIVRKNPLNKSNTLPGYFDYIKPLRAKI